MYIEDLILRTAGHGQWLFESPINLSTDFEKRFIESVAEQVDRGEALTEKQANLALKLLGKIETELIAYFKVKTWDLLNPSFKKQFRTILPVSSIEVDKSEIPGKIVVRFPYHEATIKDIKDFKIQAGGLPADWHPDRKAWVFALREDCIQFLQSKIVPRGFTSDENFKELVAQVENIENNLEDYLPMVVLEDGKPKFINVFQNVPQPTDNDIVHALFLARQFGITTYSDEISQWIEGNIDNPITKSLINATYSKQGLWVNSKTYAVDTFKDIVTYGQPLLVVIPGGTEYKSLKEWHEFVKNCGIADKDISVMFRLPNEGKGDFNIYVKDHNLNNEIAGNTKVVFVSVKIPKPLVKTNIKFNAIINLGFYLNTHYTMETLIRSSPTLFFYTDSEPKVNKYNTYGYR